MHKHRFLVALALTVAVSGVVFAQGTQTGNLRGTVKMEDGTAVPGVLVTAMSPAIQGQRATTTSETGQWILRNLLPGQYTVLFELDGMATVQSSADVVLGQDTPLVIEMRVATEQETIIVTGDLSSVLADSQVSTNFDFDMVNELPIRNRTPFNIAQLAPALTTNTPNVGQVSISGGFAYDNVWLVDGVDINDNLFGTANPVFIEDAIADLQVLTSGISAEYGRFSGGVVNVITKAGGNEWSGTLRSDLSNDDWRKTTPLEEERGTVLQDDVNEIYSATLGGYFLKDNLWFFGAARDNESSQTGSFFLTGFPQTIETTEDRQELKLTGNLLDKHQVQAQYTNRDQSQLRPSVGASATPNTMDVWSTPSELRVGRYSGVWSDAIFGELQYSEKEFTFITNESQTGPFDLRTDSPFWDDFGSIGVHWNAPHWDVSDPEDRNNEQLAARVSFFFDSATLGTHDLKVGFEDLTTINTGGNSQSPTDFQFIANPLFDDAGNLVITDDQNLVPVWEPYNSGAWQFLANRNARVETTTSSLYLNDSWQLDEHWSFNVGARYEKVDGETQSNIITVDNSALVPRLGASYDLRGDGKFRFDLTYAEYAGKYSESQFAENTDVGNPAALLWLYIGPPGVGLDFDPAFDFNNELGLNYEIIYADDGTQNVFVDSGITSPTVEEITLAAGMELSRGGFLKMIFTDRAYTDFVEDFTNLDLGTTEVIVEGVSAGEFSNTFITNSNDLTREYQALQLIGRYRLSDNWTLDGNYTYQFKNDGNFEGENTNQPGISSNFGDYPEITPMDRYLPVGPLDDFCEHKLRVWSTYNFDLGRAGNLSFGALANFDSGRARSRSSSLSLTDAQFDILDSLGYVDQPGSRTIYYGERRGDVLFDDALTFDLALNYQLPVWKDVALWIKADVTNVFDADTQIDGRSDVLPDFDGPLDSFGLPTTFIEPSDFGTPRTNTDFVLPREYRLTVGFRF